MKKFLKKVLVLFAVFVSISVVLSGITYYKKSDILNYEIPKDKHIVIMGNSQTEMAINDSGLDGVINLSKSAKQYLYQKIDIENLIKTNPQIDTIFLNISPFTIRKNDADENYRDQALAKVYTYYTPYLTLSDWAALPLRAKYFKSLICGECLRYLPQTQKPGAYVYNTRNDMEADRAKEERIARSNKKSTAGNKITQRALDDISALCTMNNVRLIYISPPLYHASTRYNLKDFRQEVNRLQTKHNADYWDYVDHELPDSCFSDMSHLNGPGATAFTTVFKERLGR